MRHYCTADELAFHNHEGSLWVAIFGKVLDLTEVVARNSGDDTRALVEAAGQDISHWFSQEDGRVVIKTHIHPVTLLPAPFLPLPSHHHNYSISSTSSEGNSHNSKILHIPPPCPRSDYSTAFGNPWWNDSSLVTSLLTSHPRKIKIINTLTSQERILKLHHYWLILLGLEVDILDVCGEESLADIKSRYFEYNKHANSYAWKRLGNTLGNWVRGRRVGINPHTDMKKTLDENGITDENEVFTELRVNETYIPAIHLYFIDDLTFD